MGISTAWYEGLEEKEKKGMETLIKSSSLILRRLDDVLSNQLKNLEDVETNVSTYGSPSWAYKQAHINGQKATLKTIRGFLNIKD